MVTGLVTGAGLLSADEPPRVSTVDQTAVFMRAKLASSQRVVEGLVTEDFGIIEKAAREMKGMSEATQWPSAKDESYEHYRQAFRRDCDRLARSAAEQNLAEAHLTYLHLTTTCIHCHEYVRRAFRISKDETNPKGPVILIPNEWEGSAQPSPAITKEVRHVIHPPLRLVD